MAFSIGIRMDMDTSAAQQSTQGLLGSIGGFASGAVRAFGAVGLAISGFQQTIGAVAGKVMEFVTAAAVQEQAVAGLEAALAHLGPTALAGSQDLQAFASEMQNLTGTGDEVILGMQSMLASMAGLSGEGLKGATKASLDLAAALKMDVNTAAKLVAQAMAGNTAALGRYIPELRGAEAAGLDQAGILDILVKKYGGTAEIAGNTLEGAIKKLTAAWGDMKERIGEIVTSSPAFQAILQTIQGLISGLIEQPEKWSSKLAGVIGTIISVGETVKAGFDIIITAVRNAFYTVTASILSVAEGVMKALNWLGLASDESTENISNLAQASREAFVENLEDAKDAFSRFGDAVQGKGELAIAWEKKVAEVAAQQEENKAKLAELSAKQAALAHEEASQKEIDAAKNAADHHEQQEKRKQKNIGDTIAKILTAAEVQSQEQSLIARGFQLVGAGAFGSTLVNPVTGEVVDIPAAGTNGEPREGQVVNQYAGAIIGGEAMARQGASALASVSSTQGRLTGVQAATAAFPGGMMR